MGESEKYAMNDALIRKYGSTIGPYGIAVYNALSMFSAIENIRATYPSNKKIADMIGASEGKVSETMQMLTELRICDMESWAGHPIALDEELRMIATPGPPIEGCEWCGTHVPSLHEHHHPIMKRDTGEEFVNICPNCHVRAHDTMFVIDGRMAETVLEIADDIKDRLIWQVKTDFPLLWQQGDFHIPYTREIVTLTPPQLWEGSAAEGIEYIKRLGSD